MIVTCGACRAAESPAVDGVPSSLRDIFAAEVSLEGCWIWNWLPGYDVTALCVKHTGGATFELEFVQSTDYRPPEEHRTTATWSGAGLVLAEPFKAMRDPTRILYPVRVLGEECLVPDSCLAKWKPGQPLFGVKGEEEFAFLRAGDGLVEKRRAEGKALWESLASEGGAHGDGK